MSKHLIASTLAAPLLAASFTLAQTPPAGPPKPAPELSQLKFFVGIWQCEGNNPASPFGSAHKTQASVQTDMDLGGFWQTFRYQETKTADNPAPMQGHGYWGYDPAGKKFISAWMDNMGGLAQQTSPGFQGDALVWTGDGMMGGKRIPSRDTFTKKGEATLLHKGELQIDGKWVVLDQETCQKGAAKK